MIRSTTLRGKYVVDYRVNSMAQPVVIFALPGDDKVRDATITLLQLEKWERPFRSVAVFEDQEEGKPEGAREIHGCLRKTIFKSWRKQRANRCLPRRSDRGSP